MGGYLHSQFTPRACFEPLFTLVFFFFVIYIFSFVMGNLMANFQDAFSHFLGVCYFYSAENVVLKVRHLLIKLSMEIMGVSLVGSPWEERMARACL